jgi:peptide-methionine (S)-S-oxide reductase
LNPLNPLEPSLELATFGGGCFWKIEDRFRSLPGVIKTSVGYMGGHFENPCYLDVLSRITGHAEVAQVQFDPDQIAYDALLDAFWAMHDPSSLNRQGADRGEQYRSVIFYHSPEQQRQAQRSKQQLDQSGKHTKPIVTDICPESTYWLATDDHQQYLEKKRSKKNSKEVQ